MTDTSTLGRAASLRVAYAAAIQDVAALREENARLKAERDTATTLCNEAAKLLHDADLDTAQHVQLYIGERDAARSRADAAEAEVVRLRDVIETAADECGVCYGNRTVGEQEYPCGYCTPLRDALTHRAP